MCRLPDDFLLVSYQECLVGGWRDNQGQFNNKPTKESLNLCKELLFFLEKSFCI